MTEETADLFRQAFRRHAAGVAIITARLADGTPVGFTATSLASLSADPPLATFNMARTASTWPAVSESDLVAIHTLGARNRAVAQRMSGEHALRFAGSHWHAGPHNLPIIDGVTSWMVGRIVERVPVGSSAVVVVRVEEAGLGADDDSLLYRERSYFTSGPPA